MSFYSSCNVAIAIKNSVQIDEDVCEYMDELFEVKESIGEVKYWFGESVEWNFNTNIILDFLNGLDDEDYGFVRMTESGEFETAGDYLEFDIYPYTGISIPPQLKLAEDIADFFEVNVEPGDFFELDIEEKNNY